MRDPSGLPQYGVPLPDMRRPGAEQAVRGPALAIEYGVEWVSDDGHRFVAAGYTEAAARRLAQECAGKGWSPRAGRAMRRVVGEWFPIDEVSD